MIQIDAETIKLRERLGKGARYDAAAAPARELGWARRGTAYFARKLNELHDDELDEPTLIPGWTRRRLIGHVGNQARDLARIVEAARTGQPWQDALPEAREAEANSGTLPARALRNIFYHSEVHLNVEWRDLMDADWDKVVTVANGQNIAVRDTPAIRARAVWIHAVDLLNNGSFRDFLPDFLEWLAMRGKVPHDTNISLADTVRRFSDRGGPVNNGERMVASPRAISATEFE
jgi:maleylpyruvate isomerase